MGIGLFGKIFGTGEEQADAIRLQALQQQRLYLATLNEQRNAAILEGLNIALQVATINAGGGDAYADDPFNRKRKNNRISNSTQLGIY